MCGSDPSLSAPWSSSSGTVHVALSGAHKGQLLPWLPTCAQQTHQSPTWLPKTAVGVASARVPCGPEVQGGSRSTGPPTLSWKRPSKEVRIQSYVFSDVYPKVQASLIWDAASVVHYYVQHQRFVLKVLQCTSVVLLVILGTRSQGLDGADPKVCTPGWSTAERDDAGKCRAGVQVGVAESSTVGPHLRRLGLWSWRELRPSPSLGVSSRRARSVCTQNPKQDPAGGRCLRLASRLSAPRLARRGCWGLCLRTPALERLWRQPAGPGVDSGPPIKTHTQTHLRLTTRCPPRETAVRAFPKAVRRQDSRV